jgi:cell division transport system ATP-binding protein
MINFHNVTKSYGPHVVLDEVNFEINSNEFVIMNGVSGAGKSTVVSLLIGADRPNSGTIEVDGMVVNEMNNEFLQMYRRKIGVVYQDYKLLPSKTVYENVAFAMEVCEAPNDAIERRVPEVLEKVGLFAFADQFPDQLSGGERQRLAIARALVHNPRFLIADEPTGNLDEANVRGILDLFKQLHSEGASVFLTTHDPLVQQQLHGRILTLDKGRII